MARINPGNHPMGRATQSHMTYRASAYFPGEPDEEEFFAWRRASLVVVGHDVWIGHGAIILPGRTVGTGAVVGAGAVVTKDSIPMRSSPATRRASFGSAFRLPSRSGCTDSRGGTGITTDCGRRCPISGSCRSRPSLKNTS
jgi:hypothetical protein